MPAGSLRPNPKADISTAEEGRASGAVEFVPEADLPLLRPTSERCGLMLRSPLRGALAVAKFGVCKGKLRRLVGGARSELLPHDVPLISEGAGTGGGLAARHASSAMAGRGVEDGFPVGHVSLVARFC
jgi:hypothetical protein